MRVAWVGLLALSFISCQGATPVPSPSASATTQGAAPLKTKEQQALEDTIRTASIQHAVKTEALLKELSNPGISFEQLQALIQKSKDARVEQLAAVKSEQAQLTSPLRDGYIGYLGAEEAMLGQFSEMAKHKLEASKHVDTLNRSKDKTVKSASQILAQGELDSAHQAATEAFKGFGSIVKEEAGLSLVFEQAGLKLDKVYAGAGYFETAVFNIRATIESGQKSLEPSR